jgi:hypothetical protein
MLDELRAAVEEENSVQIRNDYNLLPILNRAHEVAYKVLAQVYPDPISEFIDIPVTSQTINIPETVGMDKIYKSYWVDGAGRKIVNCNRAGLQHFSDTDATGSSNFPAEYVLYGRKIRFSSAPNGTLRMWYMTKRESLVEPIATIDSISGTDTLLISDLDDQIDFTASRLSSYVNIVDATTGIIKATVQVRSSDSNNIVIRTSPDRSSVLNRPISSDLTTLIDISGMAVSVEADDLICPINGTAVLPYWDLVHGFVLQESIATLKRELGYAYDVDQQLVTTFRIDMRKAATAGADAPITIRRRNPIWNMANWNSI